MAMSDTTIKRLVNGDQIRIDPFDESRLTPAGYDLGVDKDISLNPGERKLVATLERVELPPNLLGILHLRSSFAREGLLASLALVDPGFKGQLTVSLLNAGKGFVKMIRGERFLQLTFIGLSTGAERPYNGQYQESFGVVESKRKAQP
jgi:dCTP deaminase